MWCFTRNQEQGESTCLGLRAECHLLKVGQASLRTTKREPLKLSLWHVRKTVSEANLILRAGRFKWTSICTWRRWPHSDPSPPKQVFLKWRCLLSQITWKEQLSHRHPPHLSVWSGTRLLSLPPLQSEPWPIYCTPPKNCKKTKHPKFRAIGDEDRKNSLRLTLAQNPGLFQQGNERHFSEINVQSRAAPYNLF